LGKVEAQFVAKKTKKKEKESERASCFSAVGQEGCEFEDCTTFLKRPAVNRSPSLLPVRARKRGPINSNSSEFDDIDRTKKKKKG